MLLQPRPALDCWPQVMQVTIGQLLTPKPYHNCHMCTINVTLLPQWGILWFGSTMNTVCKLQTLQPPTLKVFLIIPWKYQKISKLKKENRLHVKVLLGWYWQPKFELGFSIFGKVKKKICSKLMTSDIQTVFLAVIGHVEQNSENNWIPRDKLDSILGASTGVGFVASTSIVHTQTSMYVHTTRI